MEMIMIGVLTLLGGIFGAYAGSRNTSKAWRRYGIPLLVVLCSILFKGWWGLLSLSLIGVLSMGHGIPDYSDEGSSLGQFWAKFFKGPQTLDILVRGTIAILVMVSVIYAPIISGQWTIYLIWSAVFLLIHILFSAIIEGEPVWHSENYTFLAEDFIVFSNMTLYCLGMVSML